MWPLGARVLAGRSVRSGRLGRCAGAALGSLALQAGRAGVARGRFRKWRFLFFREARHSGDGDRDGAGLALASGGRRQGPPVDDAGRGRRAGHGTARPGRVQTVRGDFAGTQTVGRSVQAAGGGSTLF
uniref:(northern house mosquito) hypothetical protein n=1 Tax=Culex pipiens TaxID=7175 RepID=A0A8D8ID35_CULPI